MGVQFTRFQLRATTSAVKHMRYFVDGCSHVIRTVSSPFVKAGRRLSLEGPWLIALLVCTWISVVPLAFYPYVKTFVLKDRRTLLEEERVRLCLQKGIDPYPYLKKKDFVYGNNFAGLAREEEYPLVDAWEHRAMLDFQREKELLLQETQGSDNDTIEKLVKLRDILRQEVRKNRFSTNEPEDLVFGGRADVNKL